LDLQPRKQKGTRGKNIVLTITTVTVLILIIISLQLLPHPTSPTAKVLDLGNKVASTRDWQGLAWGETRKLAVDSRGTIYLAYRAEVTGFQGYKAYVDFSTDNGLTWSHLGNGPIDTSYPGTQVQRVPAISIGSNNVLQVVWNEVPNEASGDRQIWYSRWLGDKWSAPVNIPFHINGYQSAMDTAHWQEHPDILVDRLNPSRVYVVWEGTDLVNLASGSCPSNCTTPMFTESQDGGITWSNYTRLASANGESQSRPTIIQDSNGELHVAWYGPNPAAGGNALIRYVYSNDYGKTWSPETQPVPESYGIDQRYPSLAADSSGNVYLVWKERSQLSTQNQTLYSLLSGGIWSPPTIIHPDSQNQMFPTIQVDNASNVYVGWYTGGPYSSPGNPSSQFNGSQVWLAKFNGTLWSTRQLTSSATNRFINFPANPINPSSVQIAWIEGDSPGPYNIMYDSFTW
jgi:hypothetical protein